MISQIKKSSLGLPFLAYFLVLKILSSLFLGCSSTPDAYPKKVEDLTSEDCRIYVVYPPYHSDSLVSTKIAKEWMAHTTLQPCDRIVGYDQGLEFLVLVGAHNLSDIKEILSKKIIRQRIRQHLKATHVISIKTDTGTPTRRDARAKATVYRLFPYKLDTPKGLGKEMLLVDDQKRPLIKPHAYRKFFKFLDILPNSMALGFSGKNLNQYTIKRIFIIEEKNRTILPPIFSSFEFSSILHPFQFDHYFDFNLRPYSTLSFHYIDTNILWGYLPDPHVQDPSTIPLSERRTYYIQGIFLAPLVGIEFSLISALGTTFLGAAIGPGFSYVQDTYQLPKGSFHSDIQVSLGHRAFLTSWGYERLYVSLGATTDSLFPPLVENEDFTITGRTGVLLGLGYYFPERQYLVRKAL